VQEECDDPVDHHREEDGCLEHRRHVVAGLTDLDRREDAAEGLHHPVEVAVRPVDEAGLGVRTEQQQDEAQHQDELDEHHVEVDDVADQPGRPDDQAFRIPFVDGIIGVRHEVSLCMCGSGWICIRWICISWLEM
jgi:hypothetical protein